MVTWTFSAGGGTEGKGKMRLKAILALLGSGEVSSVINVMQTLVHAVMDEFRAVREDHDQVAASQTEAINKVEDRTCASIAGLVEILSTRMEAAAQDLNKRMILLDEKVLKELEESAATVRTHVERLEGRISAMEVGTSNFGTLAGYKGELKE